MKSFVNRIGFRKWFAIVFLLGIFARIFARQFSNSARGGASWQTADWLINYSGGFVRRGLFGELFLSIPVPGSIGLWILFGIQLALYGTLLLFAYFIMMKSNFSWVSMSIWLGPAALGFFAWDGGSSFRKEVLTYLVLIVLVAARKVKSNHLRLTFTVLGITLFALAVFSWESSALFIPLITYLIWTDPQWAEKIRMRIAVISSFSLIGVLGALNSVLNDGDSQTAGAICQRLREQGYVGEQICSGAIDAIGWSSSYALNYVQSSYPLYLGFFLLAPLAFVAVLYAIQKSVNPIWVAIISISFVPLFIVGVDYGRWISMAVISLAFVSSTIKRIPDVKKAWFPYLTIVYLTVWGLPHWLDPNTTQWPWLGLISSVIEIGQKLIMQ
jgi:hypothetical protein